MPQYICSYCLMFVSTYVETISHYRLKLIINHLYCKPHACMSVQPVLSAPESETIISKCIFLLVTIPVAVICDESFTQNRA